MQPRCCRPVAGRQHHGCIIPQESSVPEGGQNNCPKHVEMTGIINKPLLLHLVGCLYYLYQWCTVKQISDNEIYLLTKYIKIVLWRVAKRLSYIEDARCLKVNDSVAGRSSLSLIGWGDSDEFYLRPNGVASLILYHVSCLVTLCRSYSSVILSLQ